MAEESTESNEGTTPENTSPISKEVIEPEFRPWGMEIKQYLMLMHLSQLGGYVVPMAGLILPIVMWASFKDQNEEINKHGKHIMNWIITSVIYFAISFALVFIFLGIFFIVAIAICSTIFAIIGGIRAQEGKFFRYPMNIKFIK